MRFTYHPLPEKTVDPDRIPYMRKAFQEATDEISNPAVQDLVDALIKVLADHFTDHEDGPDDRLARSDAEMAIAAFIWAGDKQLPDVIQTGEKEWLL